MQKRQGTTAFLWWNGLTANDSERLRNFLAASAQRKARYADEKAR